MNVKRMAQIAIMTALACILGPCSLPIGPVPVSLSTMAVFLSVYALGRRDGCLSVAAYILLGGIGLPVFSGFSGGLAKLFGPTGGYIIGFLFMAAVGGYFVDRFWPGKIYMQITGMILGEIVLYVFGTVWFMFLMKTDLAQALTVCVIPFLPFDLIKIMIAAGLGTAVRAALSKTGIMDYGQTA